MLWHELVSVAPNYIQSQIDSARVSVEAIEHFKIGILLLSIAAFSLVISDATFTERRE